jgi:hypothetical protein
VSVFTALYVVIAVAVVVMLAGIVAAWRSR